MAWWEILVGIILFIVALGVLIGIHELGHLSAAKMFHVYCFNYSIGFGPKLLSTKRSKKHETVWTLRAIPLGGFVSMYGEGVDLDTDEFIPMSRSLEGIARYKRAIIISAGVFLNFILGFVLIFIHNAAFDQKEIVLYRSTNNFSYMIQASVDESIYTGDNVIKDKDGLALELEPLQTVEVKKQQTSFYIINDSVSIGGENYVLGITGYIPELNNDPDLSLSIRFYSRRPYTDVIDAAKYDEDNFCTIWMRYDGMKFTDENIKLYKDMIRAIPDDEKLSAYHNKLVKTYEKMEVDYTINPEVQYDINKNTPEEITTEIKYFKFNGEDYASTKSSQDVTIKLNKSKNGWNKLGIAYRRHIWHYNAGESFKVSWDEWCNANTAVFRGLGMLFTGSGDVSGPIGIAQASISTLANYGFETYLYLWGMISCNLAILNLLPFPGLDGWSLVVIGYEAITKKQIPTKVKGIISVIGLGLLFLLMIFIIIKDVIGLIV